MNECRRNEHLNRVERALIFGYKLHLRQPSTADGDVECTCLRQFHVYISKNSNTVDIMESVIVTTPVASM
jgi:hypothetical protein